MNSSDELLIWELLFEHFEIEFVKHSDTGEEEPTGRGRVRDTDVYFLREEYNDHWVAYRDEQSKSGKFPDGDVFDNWFINEYLVERDNPFTERDGFIEGME